MYESVDVNRDKTQTSIDQNRWVHTYFYLLPLLTYTDKSFSTRHSSQRLPKLSLLSANMYVSITRHSFFYYNSDFPHVCIKREQAHT